MEGEIREAAERPLGRPVAIPRSYEVAKAGISMGTALAIAISWSVHKSILWAIVHGFLSWIYVVYYALTR